MMRINRRVVPAASVAILALVAVLPWGLPADGRFVLPFLPVVAIHYWASRHPERLSVWVPFVAGLVVDVLSNGPLGFWPLLYLVSTMLGVEAHTLNGSGPAVRWAAFVAALAALVFAAWGVASLYHMALSDWRPFAWAAWLAALCYPLLAFLLRALDPEPLRPNNDRLARGV